mgnify:CR=1 FL=1
MNILIHRGADEIGGNCIEVEANGKSILLDLGAPLSGNLSGLDALPPVKGLTDGSNPNLLAIVISHPHADHYGLVGFAHPSIPVYIGEEADKMLRAAMPFSSFGAAFPITKHYSHRKPFHIGEFRITPYLADHSAFDSYSLLIEANGKRLFYSGDLRGHGWKVKAFESLLNNPPKDVDAMLLEGTTLGRNEEHPIDTEAELVPKIIRAASETKGIILAGFSGQNIDRLVTFYKAALSSKRTFVVDMYIAHLLLAINRKTLPNPTSGAMRVFLPKRMKSKIMRDKSFDLIAPFYDNRIYPDELNERKDNIIMSFRSSMIADLETADCLQGGRLVYSMWSGYIERSKPNLRDWCLQHNIEFEIIHTSGHASKTDLKRLVSAIKPKSLVPIHTIAHSEYNEFGYPIMVYDNGVRFAI